MKRQTTTLDELNKAADTEIGHAPLDDDDVLLDTASAALLMGDVSPKTLELARHKKTGPPYIKVTARLVRYRKGDLKAYLKSRNVGSPPENGGEA